MIHYSFIFFLLCLGAACKQAANEANEITAPSDQILTSFHKLSATPNTITYRNNLPVNNEGGHIQSIQPYTNGEGEFVIVTGSSSTASYYAIIKIGDNNEVISVNPILEKPFKHAGGFQVHQNLMAIGIEDNEARNVSKVYVYEIDTPLTPPEKPKKIIERTGAYERATAGCVGITRYKEQVLVVVGDWGTRHLDIYACPLQTWEHDQTQFEQLTSMTASEIQKEEWSDPSWLSYQNINLINWQDTLYLVGLGANSADEDVADLFRMEETDLKDFHLKKIASQKFEKKNGSSFRWGAGVAWNPEKGIERILSCPAHINDISLFNEYKSVLLLVNEPTCL